MIVLEVAAIPWRVVVLAAIELLEVEGRDFAYKLVAVHFDPVERSETGGESLRDGPGDVVAIHPEVFQLCKCCHGLGEDTTQVIVVQLYDGFVKVRGYDVNVSFVCCWDLYVRDVFIAGNETIQYEINVCQGCIYRLKTDLQFGDMAA
jgi:hypothetical protein